MRQKCGLWAYMGEEKLLWDCPNQAVGARIGFFSDVRMYYCAKCSKEDRRE